MKLATALSILLTASSHCSKAHLGGGRSISALAFNINNVQSSSSFVRALDLTNQAGSCNSQNKNNHQLCNRAPFTQRVISRANPLLLYPTTAASANSIMTATTRSHGIITRGGSSVAENDDTKRAKVVLNSAVQTEAEAGVDKKPVEIFRKDYQAPANWVTDIDMEFDLRDKKTILTSYLSVSKNTNSGAPNGDLVLDGDETSVSLLGLSIGDKTLEAGVDYEVFPGKLVIKEAALYDKSGSETPILKTVVELVPEDNTALSGLYKSGGAYCSQCEVRTFTFEPTQHNCKLNNESGQTTFIQPLTHHA
jgi:hypothetical protein